LRAFLVALAAFAAYVPALSGEFVWGDISAAHETLGFYPLFEEAYHRPFADLSRAIDGFLWGPKPAGHHIASVLIHVINSVLVSVIGYRLFGSASASLVAGLLFALHPAHTEAVAWVYARPAPIMTMFFLSAFLLFKSHEKTGSVKSLVAGGLFMLLAALSGQGALVFPLVALFALCVENGKALKARALLVPMGVSLLALFAYLLFFRGTGEFFPKGGMGAGHLSDMAGAMGYYIEKLALPLNLSLVPAVPENPVYYILAILPFVLSAFLFSVERRMGAFLAAWVIITLIPSLLIVLSGTEPSLGERYLYLPSVGFCLLLAGVAAKARSRVALLACVVPVLAFYAAGTYDRARDWKDDLTLWADATARNPGSSLARINYGMALIREGSEERGVEELSEAVVQDDLDGGKLLHVIESLSSLDADYNVPEERLLARLVAERGEAEGYGALGLAYFDIAIKRNGDGKFFNKAVVRLERALRLSPDSYKPHYYLGESYLCLKNWGRAEEHLRRALELGIDGQHKRNAEESLSLIRMLRDRGLIG
jgi:tetratricopeptide (TPR) repeat protein